MATAGRRPARRPPGPSARASVARYGSPADRAAGGRSCRSETPRSSHAVWEPGADRSDPIALLEEQAAERVPELVPIRYGRMSASPFAFYRGAAYVMASDLAGTPQTGIRVQLCGDAHLANFGGFASAERQLLFDRRRLRRDPARTMGVGSEATRSKRGCRGSGERLHGETANIDRPPVGRRVPARDPPPRDHEDSGCVVRTGERQ